MTTPRPTADLVTSPVNLPHDVPTAGDLPDWLPDESTLNRLAGEFFAALPGQSQSGSPLAGSSQSGSSQAWIVTAGYSQSQPGSSQPARRWPNQAALPALLRLDPELARWTMRRGWTCRPGPTPSRRFRVTPAPIPVAPVAGGAPGGLPAFSPPGLSVTDPAAALGLSPSRAIPDLTEAAAGGLGIYGLGAPLPEEPIVPGLTGLDLASPGEFTPTAGGLAAPLPGDGAPGVPASDQLAGAGGLPNGPPDVTSATPFAVGGFGPPLAPPAAWRGAVHLGGWAVGAVRSRR